MGGSKTASALRIEHKDPEIVVVLQTSLFRVPRFQRSYVWQTEQVIEFAQDLWDGFHGRKTWFIGTIIVAKSAKIGRLGPALDVIDGQQRLITLFVWLAALRDECRVRTINDLADFVDATYLRDKSPMAPTGGQPRLTIGEGEINSFFQALVIDGKPTRPPLHGSEERIQTAFDRFRESITVRLDDPSTPNQHDLVADVLEWLKESLHAFVAVAPDLASASKVFDLMNSRGRPLEASDLLKSYLFYVTGGAAASEWATVAQTFDPVAADAEAVPEIDTFIRHQWFSRHPIPSGKQQRGAPSKRATQDLIRAEAADRPSALKYLGELRSDAEMYVQLARPTQQYWERRSGKGVFEALQDLNVIKVEVFRPLILAVVRTFSPNEQILFLRSLLSWAFRKKVVTGKLGSGEDEEMYFAAASKVSVGTARTTKDVLTLLDIPDDTRFKQSFRSLNIAARQARFVLGRLEDVIEGSGERSTKWDDMTLEHILPESPARLPGWPTFTAEQHRSYRQNIGNLTLLRKVPNERAGNGPFATKIRAYGASVLKITNSIPGYGSWTPEAVEKRAAWFADYSIEAWPLLAPPTK
ncbi:MAG: DUF262 domain-containing HNH endonuclease family protein [Chloroflexota bacterium]